MQYCTACDSMREFQQLSAYSGTPIPSLSEPMTVLDAGTGLHMMSVLNDDVKQDPAAVWRAHLIHFAFE